MKLLVAAIVFISLFFLFGGLFSVGLYGSKSPKKTSKTVELQMVEGKTANTYSMNQIDSISAAYNYPFTSANGKGTSVYAVAK